MRPSTVAFSAFATDGAVLAEIGARFVATRLARNLTQQQVADQAGVSKRTLERLEAGGSVQLAAFIRIARALGLIEQFEALLPAPGVSPIALLELQGRTRRRASRRPERPEWTEGSEGLKGAGKTDPWSWGPGEGADGGAGSRLGGASNAGEAEDKAR